MIDAATTSHRSPAIFVYEHSDVPEGLTLDAWRIERARERRATRRRPRRLRSLFGRVGGYAPAL